MTSNHKTEPLYALQYIRAVAAMVVVVCHVAKVKALGVPLPGSLLTVLNVGADSAVDAFFILSGFVMVYTQQRAQRSAGEFALKRIERVVPLYWVTTLAFALLVLLTGPASHGPRQILHDATMVRGYVATSMLFASHFVGYHDPIVPPGWSLEYEMIFYAVFTLAIRFSPRHTVGLCMAALAALVLGGLLRPLCIEFAWGCALALAYQRGWHRMALAPALTLGLAAIVLGVNGGYYYRTGHEDLLRVVFCGLPMLALLIGAVTWQARRWPIMLALGDCSYAIYVAHWAWMEFFIRLMLPHLQRGNGLVLGAALGWCLATGVATHYLVDRKLTALLRHGARRGPARARGAAIPMGTRVARG